MNTYTFDEIPMGLTCRFERQITTEMEDTFRGISGDENPLHKYDQFAQKAGFSGHIAFGMLTASLYSTLCGMYLPGKNSLIHSMDLKFLQPVFAGDTLMVEGVVADKQEGLKLISLKAKIVNQGGKCVSKANIKVLVLQ